MRENLKIGWQTALTYQAPEPVDRDSLYAVLDRMAGNGMNFLSVMVESHGKFDPAHDGICWPTDNAKLAGLADASSPNSHRDTEFLGGCIDYAAQFGIDVNLMLHWHIVKPERLQDAYPDIAAAAGVDHGDFEQTYCSRNPATLGYFLDLVTDVTRLYADRGIHSVTVEGPFADWCGECGACRAWYRRTTGTETPNANMRIVADNLKMREVFSEISTAIKTVSPSVEFWAHSGPWATRGHQGDTLIKGGVDCLMNYFCHDLYEVEAMTAVMEFIDPLPCCPQTCVRDKATHNYGSKPKTPDDVRRYARAILDAVAQAPNGAGAVFFNEVYLSEANRNAVYGECKRYVRAAGKASTAC